MSGTIESVGGFVSDLSKISFGNQPTAEVWFRGHVREPEELLPRILRRSLGPPDIETIANADLESKEQLMNDSFRREGAALLPGDFELVDLYFFAEHHGLPTRLLDWTANPLAALFFAVVEQPECDGEVVMLSPDWRMTFGKDHRRPSYDLPSPPIGQRHTLVSETVEYLFGVGTRPEQSLIVPVQPDLRISRLLQQGARFTLHMPGCPVLNEAADNSRRFRIPRAKKRALLKELRTLGVSWVTLFPDPDHLCKELCERWRESPPGNHGDNGHEVSGSFPSRRRRSPVR